MRVAVFRETNSSSSDGKRLSSFSFLCSVGSFYLYITDYPLRRLLFNINNEGRGRPIGTVALRTAVSGASLTVTPNLRRLISTELPYDEDALVTSPDATAATLQNRRRQSDRDVSQHDGALALPMGPHLGRGHATGVHRCRGRRYGEEFDWQDVWFEKNTKADRGPPVVVG